jgi:hypothetical protein
VISAAGLLALDSGKQEVTIYDVASSEPRQQYTFAKPVVCKMFSVDGNRRLAFTALFDLTATTPTEPAVVSK